jgi:Na+/melibiose symporter-like transporter
VSSSYAPLRHESVDAEARNDLQARLLVLSKILFWNFVLLIASIIVLYQIYPEIRPTLQDYVLALASAGMVCLLAHWQVLARRPL